MRSNILARTAISLTAVLGLAAGTVAAAGTSFAASPPAATTAVSAQDVSVLAVNNLGLTSEEAKKIQRVAKDKWGYTGAIDGLLGTESWKAIQRWLLNWGYPGPIDGIVGPNTIKALQKYLKEYYGYTGAIDGDAGSGTRAAFKRMANACPAC
ncbi:peptidoglycan-binding protein [Streptomyces sp. NPDC002680]|uniref:peptidoglycan-binding domain-containing protein n=1 Tax=Streptomyces sp. NPDC002680 TaxID=3364659 RepID=UPI00367BA423